MKERPIEREICFKDLAHTVLEVGKSRICRAGWQAGAPRESQCCSSRLKAICHRIHSSWGMSVFLFSPAGGEACPHYGRQSVLLRVHWFKMVNVCLIQKHSYRNIQNIVWLYIWAPGPAKLTHKINYHNRMLTKLIKRKREKTDHVRNGRKRGNNPRRVCAQSLNRVQLFVTPWTYSRPGSSVHGISQARILERVAFPSPEDLPDPRIEPASPALQADSLPGKLIKPRHSRDLKASTLQPNIKKTANPI